VSIEADIALFNKRLNDAIFETLDKEVLEAARDAIREQLNSYDWTMSRGGATGSGGLRDRTQIKGETWSEGDLFILQVTDEAEFQDGPLHAGDTLTEAVEQGDSAYKMPGPRPFMHPAEEALGNGIFSSVLMRGLHSRGF